MTRARATADTQDNNGGAVPPFVGAKNRILNSDFSIWQRGTTFTSPATGTYHADRFQHSQDGNGTVTISRQAFTPGAAPVAGYESSFFLRQAVTAAGTSSFFQISQPIEDVRTFAGQTVTFSFWAKADSNRTGLVYWEQNFGSGGSATVQGGYPAPAFTTSWQRYSYTFNLPSISGRTIGTNHFLLFYVRNGGTAAGSTLDTWGWQLEAGSVATPFTTTTGNPASELAACQRYYYRADLATTDLAFGTAFSSTTASFNLTLPVTMRGTPAASSSGTFTIFEPGTGSRSATSLSGFGYRTRSLIFEMSGASGLTVGRPLNASSGVIEINAEL